MGERLLVHNADRGTTVAASASVARGPIQRGLGLMGRRGWTDDDGLLLGGCNSIHTFCMRMSIDVLYLASDGTVLRADRAVPPWRIGPIVWRARRVLELPVGAVERSGTVPGDRLVLESSPSSAPIPVDPAA